MADLNEVFKRNDYLQLTLPAFDAFCLTVWGESRAEIPLGVRAVGRSILNRVLSGRWSRTINGVVFYKWQYSCWIPAGGEANYKAVQDLANIFLRGGRPSITSFLRVADLVQPVYSMQDKVPEIGKATHYITNALRDSKPPAWVTDPTTKLVRTIGNHTFYEAR